VSLLEVNKLTKSFRVNSPLGRKDSRLIAVNNISFSLQQGETLGLVGESGCGKSTTGKLILQLLEADQGEILLEGVDLCRAGAKKMRHYRRQLQMIFQDPYASLNPRMTIADIISEPLQIHRLAPRKQLRERSVELLEQVGLSGDVLSRYPHEFSGGQRQRIGIARALAVEPQLIIADEPVSALDLSVQAQILNLLKEIQQRHNLSYLFIAHDLAVVEHVSDRIAVMYLGEIVELCTTQTLYAAPRHPYSEALLNAVTSPDPEAPRPKALSGEIPSPIAPPTGCPFHPRCPYADQICHQNKPELIEIAPGHQIACHHQDRVGRFRSVNQFVSQMPSI
jgi:peptide/nickel transport system ATP-binding protein/oligopeptide transport system ATP-binding protein